MISPVSSIRFQFDDAPAPSPISRPGFDLKAVDVRLDTDMEMICYLPASIENNETFI
jgi:hypothetical protein